MYLHLRNQSAVIVTNLIANMTMLRVILFGLALSLAVTGGIILSDYIFFQNKKTASSITQPVHDSLDIRNNLFSIYAIVSADSTIIVLKKITE